MNSGNMYVLVRNEYLTLRSQLLTLLNGLANNELYFYTINNLDANMIDAHVSSQCIE